MAVDAESDQLCWLLILNDVIDWIQSVQHHLRLALRHFWENQTGAITQSNLISQTESLEVLSLSRHTCYTYFLLL